ncbi:dihydrofolate reductase family protein [Sorangium sp. So ce1036]|uniref:dihydrofolate reductase family protein n=1 Tax=Sorangium sp. So ce1036 TaxID=3133328 RepID=UPI003F0F2896
MRKLTYHVAATVDGFIARSDGGVDCFAHEGDHVTEYLAALKAYDAVVMGRRTYEFGLKLGVTDPYPWMDTYVVSRTMKESPDARVKLVAEDAAGAVRRLKEQQGGDIYLCGGGELATCLFDAGLVDEVILKVAPVLLGGGIALSPGLRAAAQLDLVSTKVHRSGVIVSRYAVRR